MSRDFIPGETIGGWCLERHLGSGEFGATWLARDAVGRTCALKLLQRAPGDELRVLARLAHPAIPEVYGAAPRPVPHVAMEYAPGRPLEHLLRRGRAPESAALQVAAVVADALAEVHRAGLAHGDVKPENILVERISDLRIWVVDFGAAADTAIGTLHYAAPERTRGGHASPESDVYSLGLVLFEMLFGHLPGFDVSVSAALMKRRTERPEIPATTPAVRALLARMLEVEPAMRPPAGEVADALEAMGIQLPRATGALLRRRARTVHIPPPGLAEQVSAWHDGSADLLLLGDAQTGRSHALSRARTELSARGATWLSLSASPTPWQAVAEALDAPALPGPACRLPTEPDAGLRATFAAEALARRARGALYVLVDNLDQVAESTRATVHALAQLDSVHVLATARTAGTWPGATHRLEPLAGPDLTALLGQLLGERAPIGDLVERFTRRGAVAPGRCIDAVSRACDSGVLVRRARRWHVDGGAFTDLWESLPAADQVDLSAITANAVDVAALAALYGGPVDVAQLAATAGLPRERFQAALGELLAHHWAVVLDGTVQLQGLAVGRAAVEATLRGPDLHARILRSATGAPRSSLQVLAHLVGAQNAPLTLSMAAPALSCSVVCDPEHAARLAARLWAVQPLEDIAGPVIEALIAGGRTRDAQSIGEPLLAQPAPPRAVLLAMARYALQVADDAAAALALLSRARRQPVDDAELDLALLEARAHFQLGAHAEAIAVAEAACAVAPGPVLADQETWIALQQTRAQATHSAGDVEAAIRILEAVPPHYAEDRPCHAILQGALGRLFWHAGRIHDAATALAAAATCGELPTLERARLENNSGVAFYSGGDRSRALERWETAYDHFVRLDQPIEQIRVSNNLCVGYTEAGRWERARTVGERAHALATERDAHVYAAMVAGNLGDLYAAREAFDDARAWYRTAAQVAHAHDVDGEKVELARRVAEVAVRRRDADAELRSKHAMRVAQAAGDEVEGTRARLLWLLCRARAPQPEAGLATELTAAIEVFREKKLTGHIAEARVWSAEALLALGDTETALKVLDLAGAHADSANHVPLQGRIATLKARARAMTVRTPERRKFERMLQLATAVAREQDPSKLLDAIASAGLELLDAERSFVVLMEGDAQRVVRAIGKDGPLDDPTARPSRTILAKALHRTTAYTALDVSERQDLSASKSIALNALRSAMCVPMRDGDDLLGVLYVDSTRTTEEQLGEAAHLMEALASHAAVAIGHARQMAALEQRAARAAELVHDLRSPLAAAASILEELRDDHIAEGETAEIHDEALALLAKSMELAEMVLGDHEPKVETVVDLGWRLTELGHQLDRHAQRQGQSVLVDVHSDARALCNPDHIDRIVRNLVGNALRFSPPRGTVTVGLTTTPDGACITVVDEGDGIPPHLLGRLFDRGAKGDTAQSQHGLGLAIVARLAKEMGGTVRAENTANVGARFVVTVPSMEAVVREAG